MEVPVGTPMASPNGARSSVSWACFTSRGRAEFGDAGCPAVQIQAARVRASAVAPAPPSGLSATVTGSTVTLTWTAPAGGDPPTSYIVDAGSMAGASNVATFDTR